MQVVIEHPVHSDAASMIAFLGSGALGRVCEQQVMKGQSAIACLVTTLAWVSCSTRWRA